MVFPSTMSWSWSWRSDRALTRNSSRSGSEILTFVVRRARPDDAAVVARLLDELGYPSAREEVRRRLESPGPDDLVLLADDLGLAALHRIPLLAEGQPLLRITAFVVRQEARGRGVGQTLMNAVEDTARRWGCRLIEVSSGRRAEREPAHRFYRAAGFSDTSSRSVRYWKRLGPNERAAG
jgi:GNAT superfamily N-acetyltransferase